MIGRHGFGLLAGVWVGAVIVAAPQAAWAAAPDVKLQNAGEIRALAVGINAYQHVQVLRGAVADALDIATTLREVGVVDVTLLTDGQASRDAIMREADALVKRSQPGDLIVLSVAGHGAREPEKVKGSEPDGMDTAFLLAGFAPSGLGSRERILNQEFNHLIHAFEARGARVLFVADSCSGGGLARSVDPRDADIVYRTVPSYQISDDELKPVATVADSFATEVSFNQSLFLAAVDKASKAPEVRVPGIDGYRGALSYAVSRAFEGAADADGDGRITTKEMFDYVRKVSYQLTDQRQNVVAASPPAPDIQKRSVVALTRSVTVLDAPKPPPSDAAPAPTPVKGAAAAPPPPVRIGSLDGDTVRLATLTPLDSPFDVVPLSRNPDLVWDPRQHDVIAAGDVIARDIELEGLPSVVDRFAAVRALKQLIAQSPQDVRLGPNSQVHRNDERVEVTVGDTERRALFLFDLAGDGTVQMLYPVNRDSPVVSDRDVRVKVKVGPPFGADHLVAVTAPQRQPDLEQALSRLNNRRAPGQIVRLLSRSGIPGLRIGAVALVTAP